MLALAVGAGVVGVTSATASPSVVRFWTTAEALPVVVAFFEQPAWLFVLGLVAGLWIRHGQRRRLRPLPFPLIAVRRGCASAPRCEEPAD